MHAHNPVDWYPWGPEAFAKAKKEGKLIFLSIGYSSCYWCHVMERESFDNPEVAKLMNKWFVSIKVDREARPDIDNIYMTAVQVMGRNGGWPLSMFLTADGKPIIGGTYWPREDKTVEGRRIAGFKTILKLVHEAAQEKPKAIQEQADQVAKATKQALAAPAGPNNLIELDRQLVADTLDYLKERFDPDYGGFGSPARNFRGPKFPTPCRLELILHEGKRTKDKKLLEMVYLTLNKMALGGIYDQLGGGFHRYSTERTWTVPHFEKMLYDNAQLVELYAKAYRINKNPLYRRIIRETLAYIQREMMSPEGAIYSSQDAETDEEEGRFYVWTAEELENALDEMELRLVRKVYGVDGNPNFENKYYIFTLPQPLAEIAEKLNVPEKRFRGRLGRVKQKLFKIRSQRERPFLNKISLTGWSGLMIAGFARAGYALEEPHYVETAKKAADFVLKKQKKKDGRLFRTYGAKPGGRPEASVDAFLEDYACLVHGLLTLHEITKEKRWLQEAKDLTNTMIEHHGDKEDGGFYFTAHDQEKLFARSKDQYDGAVPSGNSLALLNLVKLAKATGEKSYRREAEKGFRAFAPTMKLQGSRVTTMMAAVSLFLDEKSKDKKEGHLKIPDLGKKPKKRKHPVKISVTGGKISKDGIQEIKVTIQSDKGWHVYANPVGNPDLAAAETKVTITGKGKAKVLKVNYPKGKLVFDDVVGNYNTYEGKVNITASVQRDRQPLTVTVFYQACSKNTCLLPKKVSQEIE